MRLVSPFVNDRQTFCSSSFDLFVNENVKIENVTLCAVVCVSHRANANEHLNNSAKCDVIITM